MATLLVGSFLFLVNWIISLRIRFAYADQFCSLQRFSIWTKIATAILFGCVQ